MKGRILAAALAAVAPFAHADVVFDVNLTQDRPDDMVGDGICSYKSSLQPDQYAVCTLRAAVMEANAIPALAAERVQIHVQPGATYALTIAGAFEQQSVEGDLDFLRPMRISVADDSKLKAHIEGPADDRIFHLMADADGSEFVGLELTGAQTSGKGCAIYNEADDVVLQSMDIHDNCADGAQFSVVETVASMQLIDSEIHGNFGTGSVLDATGGGTTLQLLRSSVYSNQQKFMAIYAGEGAHLSMSQSTVSHNSAGGTERRGIRLTNASAWIEDSTIAFNGAAELAMKDSLDVRIERTILLQSPLSKSCSDLGGNHIELRWNIFSDAGCLPGPESTVDDAGTSMRNVMPALSELGYWGGPTRNHCPLSGSIAIDAVPPDACPLQPFDQRGLPRAVSQDGSTPARCDVGAVEFQPAAEDPPVDEPPVDDPMEQVFERFGDGFDDI